MSEARTRRRLAPAKVNLTLDVGPPRPDGFHALDSVVAAFLPADELMVTVRPGPPGVHLTCSDPALPTDGQNLVHQAVTAFLEESRVSAQVIIHLAKRLPAQAGLGGGSSDAAAALAALHELRPGLSRETLTRIAARIGSDVPLFLVAGGRGLRMTGRGERVAPLPAPLPPLHGILVKPALGVPTGSAYARLDAVPGRIPGAATPRLLALLPGGDIGALGAAMGNDFEAAILPAYPEVAAAHRAVSDAGAIRALLCGSGSAIFGLAGDAAHARVMAESLEGRFPWVQLARTCPEAPAGD